jgi:hypothetical protein
MQSLGGDPVKPVLDEQPNLAAVLDRLAEAWQA